MYKKLKIFTLCSFVLIVASKCHAQLFSPIPKPVKQQSGMFAGRTLLTSTPTLKTNQTVTILRPDVIAVTAYDTKGLNYAMAGIGLSLTSADWDETNSRYEQQWSVGVYAFAKGAISPSAPSDVFAAGINGAYKLYTGGVALSTSGQLLFSFGLKMPLAPLN